MLKRGNIPEDVNAVIFDLDGTLLNTLDDIAESMNQVLEEQGYPVHETDRYKYFVGDGITPLVKRALPQYARSDEILEAMDKRMREVYGQRWDRKTRPYEGIPGLLDGLTAGKIPMGILSNKPDEYTLVTVHKFLGSWPFEVIRGSRADTPKKPAPDGALYISRLMELDPGECVCVGDTDIDMKTAKAAGMFPVGAAWGFRTREELFACGAERVIDNPLALLDLFGKKEEGA